jgi:hypothetical protein
VDDFCGVKKLESLGQLVENEPIVGILQYFLAE